MIDPLNIITTIPDHPDLNRDNFIESLGFFGNFVKFILSLEEAIDINRLVFLPSFIGLNVSCKLGINVSPEIYEMRYIKVKASGLLVEEYEQIEERMFDLCEDIRYDNNEITFVLK